MKFCSNCGKQLENEAVFCDNCGTNVSGAGSPAAGSDSAAGTGTHASGGQPTVAPTAGGSYYAPDGTQSAVGAPGTPSQQPVNQTGPYTPPNTPGTPSGPYYQGQTSGYNPPQKYKSGGSGNKLVIIIVVIAVALALIAGGVFLYSKFAVGNNNGKPDDYGSYTSSNGSDTDNNSSMPDSTIDVVLPSDNPDAPPTSDYDPGTAGDDPWNSFDSQTKDNINNAYIEVGINPGLVTGLSYYDGWYDGTVYTFDYEDSLFDLFLREDGTVFSIETGGVQLFIDGFESYSVDDYLGYTTHYDESYPDNGYVFYLADTNLTSGINVQTSYDLDYVVELINADTGVMVMAFYVQANQDWSMVMPEGNYIIQYCAGTYWYGTAELFGDETYFYRADGIFTLAEDEETAIVLDINGGTGAPSTEISGSEF